MFMNIDEGKYVNFNNTRQSSKCFRRLNTLTRRQCETKKKIDEVKTLALTCR